MTIRRTFLDVADTALTAIASPAVQERWDEPSALAEMSVGVLAAHLARSISQPLAFLRAPAPASDGGTEPVAAQGYYGGFPELTEWSSALNAGVRERSTADAAVGPAALIELTTRALAALRERLPQEPDQRLVSVFGGRLMLLDEYLRTRLVEFAVHLDDLGVAVPDAAAAVAVEVLSGAATFRHGQLAVLRALARRERDDVQALRVL